MCRYIKVQFQFIYIKNMKQHNFNLDRIIELFKALKGEVWSVYIYAILNGLIQLSLPLGIQAIISFVLGGFVSTSLVVLITMIVLGILFNGILQVNQMKLIEKIQQHLFVRYAFSFSQHLPGVNSDKVGRGLNEKVNYFLDIVPLQKGISKLLLEIPSASIQILFGLLVLCFYHPIFILFGVSLLFILFIILRYTGNKGLESSIRESNYKYKTAAALRDTARVTYNLKFTGNTKLHIQNIDTSVYGYVEARTAHFKVLLSQYWSLIAFKVVIIASMLIVGVMLLLDQKLNIGQFIAIEIVVITVLNSIEKFIINLEKVYDIFTAFNKLDQLLEIPREQNGSYLVGVETKLQITGKELYLETSEHKTILRDANFEITTGEKIFISGNDALAKTLFLETISGINTFFSGNLLINQLPINNYDMGTLRLKYGVLSGHRGIIKGTLLENITLGRATISIKHILELAEQIGFTSLLQGLNKGLDSSWPDKELTSEHERYILLLRAIVGNPSVLLLDEPFSGVSPHRSEQIKNFIFNKLKGVTLLITSHDLEIAKKCDREFVFENGILIINKMNNQ